MAFGELEHPAVSDDDERAPPVATLTRSAGPRVKAALEDDDMAASASRAELLAPGPDNLLDDEPPPPDWPGFDEAGHSKFVERAMQQMARKFHSDERPARKSEGVAAHERVTTVIEGVDPPAVAAFFVVAAAGSDSIGGDDAFAADDIIPVAFPKLAEPAVLDPADAGGE